MGCPDVPPDRKKKVAVMLMQIGGAVAGFGKISVSQTLTFFNQNWK